ncbi:MAG: hypothetical protein JXA99_16210, partial [Candidatus Lokiarchaeota archaeon]|nr:hypothetical protein [Candidatus Lokiarchaeota archaeon]
MSHFNNRTNSKYNKKKKKITKSSILIIIIIFSIPNIISINPINQNSKFVNNEKNLEISDGEITIDTPENITYTEPMTGYYPGTYGFENDNIGEFPTNWEDITQDHTYCSVDVISEYKGHNNILQFYDGYSDPGWTSHAATCELDFTTTTRDTIEFWFLKASGTTSCEFQIREDDNI